MEASVATDGACRSTTKLLTRLAASTCGPTQRAAGGSFPRTLAMPLHRLDALVEPMSCAPAPVDYESEEAFSLRDVRRSGAMRLTSVV